MPVTASAVLLWLRQSTAHALGHGFQTKRFSARTVGLTAADEVVGAHAVRGKELHHRVVQKDLRTHRVREENSLANKESASHMKLEHAGCGLGKRRDVGGAEGALEEGGVLPCVPNTRS